MPKLTVQPSNLFFAVALLATACAPAPEKTPVRPPAPAPIVEPRSVPPVEPPPNNEKVAVPESLAPVLNAINRFRVSKGLRRLSFDNRLAGAAHGHAKAMAEADFFSHTGRNGSKISQRVSKAGYPWRLVAENIAAGMQSGVEAVDVWIDSPGHRKNMLTEDLTHAGIGYARMSPDPGAVVYEHYWVLVMGAPLKN